mmetsp:Transcript_23049/g.52928  ORF Transcript_23049/g.52928 Transcript_23049/m.52928 type:complete len:238 (-) Transcript_23049:1295-2008(-)
MISQMTHCCTCGQPETELQLTSLWLFCWFLTVVSALTAKNEEAAEGHDSTPGRTEPPRDGGEESPVADFVRDGDHGRAGRDAGRNRGHTGRDDWSPLVVPERPVDGTDGARRRKAHADLRDQARGAAGGRRRRLKGRRRGWPADLPARPRARRPGPDTLEAPDLPSVARGRAHRGRRRPVPGIADGSGTEPNPLRARRLPRVARGGADEGRRRNDPGSGIGGGRRRPFLDRREGRSA